MAHFVTFKLTITLYLLTVLLTILTSIPMLRHVLPKSECLLFVKVTLTFLWFPNACHKVKQDQINISQEIEVADKTTSLQYGPPAGHFLSPTTNSL